MTFNFEAAEAFGFTIVTPKPGSGKGRQIFSDVYVTTNNSGTNKRYRFSFSENASKKIESEKISFVKSPDGKRIYFAPCDNGYKIVQPPRGKGFRPFVSVSKSVFPSGYKFIGHHKLQFSKDMNGYFIEASTESE